MQHLYVLQYYDSSSHLFKNMYHDNGRLCIYTNLKHALRYAKNRPFACQKNSYNLTWRIAVYGNISTLEANEIDFN